MFLSALSAPYQVRLDEADSDIRQVESTKTEEAKTLEGVREEKTRLEDVLRQKEEALAAAYVVEKGEERERDEEGGNMRREMRGERRGAKMIGEERDMDLPVVPVVQLTGRTISHVCAPCVWRWLFLPLHAAFLPPSFLYYFLHPSSSLFLLSQV